MIVSFAGASQHSAASVSFQFFDGTDAERGCRQWTLIQDS